ncbi:MAG: sulfotransferase [Deltaproteobacteria bacterium]|nr:MAG: sulfotransferase [Deltaproteobacteria bacterium]
MDLQTLWRVLLRNRFQVDFRYWDRLLYLFAMAIFNSVFARFEHRCNGYKIKGAKAVAPPVFIIGCWRSGTTHLHNLLSLDENFTTPTYYQVMFPHHFVYTQPWAMSLFNYLSPTKRPMDNMAIAAKAPHEDEFALAALSTVSPYMQVLFPRSVDNGFAALDPAHLKKEALEEWKAAFLHFVEKLSFSKGKRIIFKSPPHLGRVRLLLELFPQAKFIHIYRNPYEVYLSMKHLWQSGFKFSHLQTPDPEAVEENILSGYTELYSLYEQDRGLIPPGALCEVRYEDLVNDPRDSLHQVYSSLGLPGFEKFWTRLTPYLESQKNYRRNSYTLDPATKEKVRTRWGPTCERYGYDLS